MNEPESTSENQSPGDLSGNELRREPLEVLAAEYSEKIRCGQLVSVDDYVRRCPELESEIKELFPTIAALEKMKAADNKDQARLATTLPLNLNELGDFEIIREIGRGGMGIVFEAVQRSLGRRVALKVLPKAALLDPKQLQRFSREAHIAAKLHHSHLVSLHGVGEHDGYHFLVMELIDGASLDRVLPLIRRKLQPHEHSAPAQTEPTDQKIDLAVERIAEKLVGPVDKPATRLDRKNYFRLVAAIGSDAAGAIQYAYQQGVFHRDIKPANLILDHDTQIWISDFGLARSLVNADGETPEDARVTKTIDGTFAYMAPESLEGHLSQQSDIYSLGVTLYEMLTLQPVWANENFSASIKRLSDDSLELPLPRSVDPSIPRDLETIVLKATARRPSERYRTAGLMAVDLQRFLGNRPVKANRTSVLQHAVRWCDRNRLSTALLATAALMLGLLVFVLATSFRRVQMSNQQVNQSLMRETKLREQSQHSLAVATKALDGIYHELVPDDLNISSYIASGVLESGKDGRPETGAKAISSETAAVLDSLIEFYQDLAKDADHQRPLAASTIASLGRIGDIYLHLGKMDQAAQRYQQALKEFDLHNNVSKMPVGISLETARILNQLGVVYRSQKYYVESDFAHLAALEELSVVIEPDGFSAQFQKARTHYLLGQREKENAARVVIDQVFERNHSGRTHPPPPPRNPGHPRKRESAGDWERRNHHLKIAIEILSDLKKQSQQNVSCNFLIGCCFRESGDSGLAIETFSDLVAQYPENPHYRFELVETLRSSFQEGRSGRRFAEDEIEGQQIALKHANWLVQHYPNAPQYGFSRMHVFHRFGHAFNNRSRSNRGAEGSQQIQKAVEYLILADQQATMLSEQWPNISDHLLWSVVVKTSLTTALLRDSENDEAAEVIVNAVDQFNDLMLHKQAGANYSDQDVELIHRALSDLAGQCGSETAQAALKPLP